MSLDMEKIMGASLGETSNIVRATFKKTVMIRQYETEVIELETTLDFGNKNITNAERMLLSAILQAQLEYSAYCNLAYKGLVTSTEFNDRKQRLVAGVNAIKEKAESLLGRSMECYFEHLDLQKSM